ncbi:putative transcription factor interactor and regulator CCHC(Zn) family [Helianthus annuus]|nr:putative transcription factor interactor and regulator CCHC(Zn) family [Helianthus annuus]
MDSQDFYNMFSGVSATQGQTNILQNVNLENELGTMQKPPKLMSLDEYSGWSVRFKTWVQANHLESWIKIEREYEPPEDGVGGKKSVASLTDIEQADFKAEKKMISILQQAIKEDILVLLQHNDTSASIWFSLEKKFNGSESMMKSKTALLKKEFDIFTGIKGESTKQLIERYCHLVKEMRRLKIVKTNEEWIDKLCDALPYDEWGTYLMMLKNKTDFINYSLSDFIEKIEAHELELVKIKKMNSTNITQDVSLYFKSSPAMTNAQSPKSHTGFSADSGSTVTPNAYQTNQTTKFASYEPNAKSSDYSPQSSSGSNQQTVVTGVHCNIAINIKNGNEITETAAKQHIALLGSVLEAYEGLVAGKIGNPDMTKEDYDQIDPEELELIDIKWGMASLVRRAQRFMEITGRNSLSGPDQKLGFDKSKVTCFKCKEKGHFKRECPNREVKNHQNPFTNDYYKQAIYHRPNQQPAVQRPQIENKPEKALIVNQDDEKVASGFSWDKFIPEKDDQAMMAKVTEITESDAEQEVVVSEDGDGKAADVAYSDSEVVEETVTENVESVPEIGSEVVVESVNQEIPETFTEDSVKDSAKAEEVISDDLSFGYQREESIYTMKSILSPNVFDTFADFFEDPRTGTCPRFEAKKDEVVELIDVSKEMTKEDLKEIADKALMSKLREVDSVVPESVDKESGLEETEAVEINKVKVSESESIPVGNMACENEALGEKVPILDTPCQRCSQTCTECLVKDTMYQDLKQHADMMKFDLEQLKVAYDTLSRSIKIIKKESFENDKATNLAQSTLFDKQKEVNIHLDTIASLRTQLELTKIENDRIDKKLMSYVASSYVLEQIVPQQPHAKPAFNSVPPPMWNHYTQKYPDGVEAALNIKLKTIENDLPDNIDIPFSASDIDNSSQVVKNVIDQVLDDVSEKSEQAKSVESRSESEEDGNFLDRYLTKSDKSTDDDSIMVAYTMIGSDKLYSNTEFPIQSVKLESIQKVFRMVEFSVNELKKSDFLAKLNKSVESSCSASPEKIEGVGKGKNRNNKLKNKGIGFEKRMAKQVVKPKERIDDVFVFKRPWKTSMQRKS